MKLKTIFILLLLVNTVFANVYYVFDISQNRNRLEKIKDKIEGKVLISPRLTDLINRAKLKIYIEKLDGNKFILRSSTLPSDELSAVLYLEMKRLHPPTYFIERGSSSKVMEHTKIVTLQVPTASTSQEDSDYTLWIALFGLAIIGVLALSLSSFQVQNLIKRHKKIQQKHEEMEQKVSEMFSMMGENIHKLSKDIVKYTNDIMKDTDSSPLKNKLKRVVNAESKVVDSASSLLDFLYLKAKKVKVKREHFNINTVLDDVLENLMKNISKDDVELIFDIDKSMPKYVVGDFRHIGEIFGKILEHIVMVSTSKDIKAEFSSNNSYNDTLEFQTTITYTSLVDLTDIDEYFTPIYDEKRSQYKRLGLYVAQELIKLMDGDISVEFNEKSNTYRVLITIPLGESPYKDRRKYHLSTKDFIQRDILIVNRNQEASLALKKMFTYFRHKVKVLSVEKFKKDDINFDDYDILMIDEKLIDDKFEYQIKPHKKDIKVVGLESIFTPFSPTLYKKIIDIRATRPMTQEKALSLIEDLYLDYKEEEEEKSSNDLVSKEIVKEKTPSSPSSTTSSTTTDFDSTSDTSDTDESERTTTTYTKPKEKESSFKRSFKSNIVETPNVTLQSFADFKGATIMIVEDNFINVKMLLKVLEHSGMSIITAENGQKALDEIEKLDGKKLDLILMDINMPIMDGYMATKKIRYLDIGKDLPIVALSALSLENEFKRMQNSGMDAYIPKPLNIGKLYTIFKMYLKQTNSSQTVYEKKPLPKLEGIDLEGALEHVDNNELLLKEILSEFISLYGNSDEEIAKLYTDKRFDQLRKYLFDLVGLASTIGAKDLAMYAQEMRKLYIYDKLPLLPSYLTDYSNSLKVIKESLKSYLS